MKLVYTKQTDLRDCGVACLMSIVRFYGGYARREYIRELTNTSVDGVSMYSMVEASPKLGLEASAVKGNIQTISSHLPVIAHILIGGNLGHFVVVVKLNLKYITVMDPNSGFQRYSYEEWNKISTNTYLLFKPKDNIIKQIEEEKFSKILVHIFKKYKKTCFFIFLLSLIYAITNVFISYGFQFFIKTKKDNLFKVFIFFVLILILRECCNLFRNLMINYLNHSLDKTLVRDVYNHIIRLPYSYFKSRRKGDIITRIEDLSKIRDTISKFVATIFIDALFVFITLFAMFHIHIKLTLLVIIITIIYINVILIYTKKISKKMNILKEEEVVVSNHFIESLSSIDTIKGMQIEDFLREKLTCKYNKLLSKSFELNQIFYRETFFKEFLYGLGYLIILLYGVILIGENRISIATLMIYCTLIIYYFNPITNICNLELLLKDAKLSFVRIKELLNIKEEKIHFSKKKNVKHLKGTIDLKDLKYSYNGIDSVLKCKKLHIKSGEKVLLYGTSGGGKSTLMKLIVGYLSNYKGEIKIDDYDIRDYDLSSLRNRITYVSQDELIYTDTIYNNIVLDKNISFEKYKAICDLVGISSIYKRSILKDDMLLENNASNLSGGEKQKIILARSLVKNSDIYIFDESFSAMDTKNERSILRNLFASFKDKTIVVISHRFNNRDLYQKFILVEKGQVYEY